jgi:hypothetical protein
MATSSEKGCVTNYVVIDSDSHVVETERTWQFMDPEDEKYRPVLDVLKAFNIFVTCQNNDELTYMYPFDPDNIVIGSDYGHYDGSSQKDATLIMRQRTDIDEQVKRKILCDNAKRLWAL